MIVDTHYHVNWLGYGPEKIIENMDRNNAAALLSRREI